MKKILSFLVIVCVFISMFQGKYVAAIEEEVYTSGEYRYTVDVNNDVTIVKYLGKQTKLKIPDAIDGKLVTTIDSYAFYKSGIESLVLPKRLRKLGNRAFAETTKLKEVTIPKTLEEVDDYYHRNGPFEGSGLTDVYFEEGTKKIPNSLFKGCEQLKNIHWGESIEEIGDYAFENTGVEELIVPDNITKIGGYAFYECNKLGKLKVSSKLKSMGNRAFAKTTKLKEVTIPKTLEEVDDYYHRNGPFEGSGLTDVFFEEGTKKIPNSLFKECRQLKSVVLPDSVTEIEDKAFNECSNFQEIYLPNKLSKIGNNAFNKCPYLVMKMNRDTFGSRYAIVNKMPFEWIGNSVENLPEGFLNRGGCEYETVTQGATANGYINFKVKFGFKNAVKKSISNAHLQIYIPDGVTVIQDTVKVNGVMSTNFEQDESFLDIPVDNNGGIVTFSVQANNYDEFYSFAEIKYRKSNVDLCEMINALNTELQPLSLNMDSETNSNTFVVSGIAMPDNDVDIYVEDEKVKSIRGTKAGTYAAVITIADMKKHKTYNIKVSSCNPQGVVIEQSQKITYIPKIPKLTDFTMEHNGQKYNLSEQKNLKPIVVFNPNKKFQFQMKFQNPDEIEDVYVVSNRSNIKTKIQAIWDEKTQLFIADGYFDENNHSYVPGAISVEYISKGEVHYINEKIDFSSDEYINSIAPQFENAQIDIVKNTQTEFEAKFVLPNMENAELNLQRERIDLADSVTEETLIKDGYIKVSSDFIKKNPNKLKISGISFEDDVLLFVKYAVSPITNKVETRIVDLRDKVVEKVTMGTVTPGTIGIISDGLDWADTVDTWKGYRVNLNEAKQNVLNSTMSYSDKEQAINRIETVRKMNNGKVALKMLGALLSVAGYTVDPAIGMALSAMTFMYDRELNATMLDIKGLSAKESGSGAINFRWAVDPSGYIYDIDSKKRVSGVTVTLYYKQNKNSKATIWNASEYLQQNPLVSAEDGEYAWDVPEGLYQVKCEKDGYETAYSDWLPVPPPQLGINIGIKKKIQSTSASSTTGTDADKRGDQNKNTTANKESYISKKTAVSSVKIKSIKRKSTSAIVSWKKMRAVKGYQLQYALNKKFKKKKSIQTKKTKYTIKKLKKKTYYIRVRAYKMNGKKKVYGKWSKVKAVKRK